MMRFTLLVKKGCRKKGWGGGGGIAMATLSYTNCVLVNIWEGFNMIS